MEPPNNPLVSNVAMGLWRGGAPFFWDPLGGLGNRCRVRREGEKIQNAAAKDPMAWSGSASPRGSMYPIIRYFGFG